jgi:hypothetical protein
LLFNADRIDDAEKGWEKWLAQEPQNQTATWWKDVIRKRKGK